MTPTAKFRWREFAHTEATLCEHPSAIPLNLFRVRVLQQWWKRDGTGPDGTPGLGEWRDVPIVEEE